MGAGLALLPLLEADRPIMDNRRMRQYDQLLADVAGTIAKLQDHLSSAEQAHRRLVDSGDDRPFYDLQEVKRLLDMAIQILARQSDARSF
jgi:hypothetical protein